MPGQAGADFFVFAAKTQQRRAVAVEASNHSSVLGGGERDSAHIDWALPFLFWWVSLKGGDAHPRTGERQVSRGDGWVRRPLPVSHQQRAYIAAAWPHY